jgi:hypothetical protein
MTSILEETLLDILADIGDMKQRLSILERREFRQRHLHSGTARELTIAAGVITVRRGDSYSQRSNPNRRRRKHATCRRQFYLKWDGRPYYAYMSRRRYGLG